jgi:hypothetical protein
MRTLIHNFISIRRGLSLFRSQPELSNYVRKCGAVVACRNVKLSAKVRAPDDAPFETLQLCRRSSAFLKLQSVGEVRWSSSTNFDGGNVFIAKKFDKCKILLKKFDIYSKIFYRDVGNFFRHLCELVLRHQMRVSNYFVNSFYSVVSPVTGVWSLDFPV